ncbi:hypothetical protein [Nocardia jiangxiensis]|uniref:hypothetical protein n=1 Tax=Nocardia jiangxiensis TaxID=282685 RepID=UPI0012F64287|nr:hypothetical protein [Nocardia jiangxiensis]
MTARSKRHKKVSSESGAHRIVVRGSRHDPPDARKLAGVIVSLAESLALMGEETNATTSDETIISIDDDSVEGRSAAA